MYQHALAAAFVATAFAALPAHAATIVEWNLAGAPGNQASTAASGAAANVTGGSITRGAGVNANAGTNSINASSWDGTAQGASSTEYFEFGFTVAPGYSVNLDSLYIGTRSSGTGPGTLGLYWSGDGYASSLHTFNQGPGDNFVNSIVSLGVLPDITGAVTFRIIEIGNLQADGVGTPTTTGTFRLTAYFSGTPSTFDRNLQFTGTVQSLAAPVPVPAAVWLLGSALAGLAGRARRRAA